MENWALKGVSKILVFGGAFLLLEFEDDEEADRILLRGLRRFGAKVL